jgi:hypothetical protein
LSFTATLVLPSYLTLECTFHDFRFNGDKPNASGYGIGHPDFENLNTQEKGIVKTEINRTDGLPVYALGNGATSVSTHGQTYFDMWFRDVPVYSII